MQPGSEVQLQSAILGCGFKRHVGFVHSLFCLFLLTEVWFKLLSYYACFVFGPAINSSFVCRGSERISTWLMSLDSTNNNILGGDHQHLTGLKRAMRKGMYETGFLLGSPNIVWLESGSWISSCLNYLMFDFNWSWSSFFSPGCLNWY